MVLSEAKKLKEEVIKWCDQAYQGKDTPTVELFFKGTTLDSLALKVTFRKKVNAGDFVTSYKGLPLIVVSP